ncbi:hypothetical protein [Sphingomonas sp. 3-13AW]|uniref:hypothetical protein n=1 Tax=Sphingomonas sp. 3-13AW TaxID=3050450 RepID=UPI003BB6FA57
MTEVNGEREALKQVGAILEEFRAAVSPVATLSLAHTFVTVALNEGKNLTEMASIMGAKVPTISRNVLDLGERNRRKTDGYRLVKSEQDPMNLRSNKYALTPRGRQIANRLIKIVHNTKAQA